MQTPEISTDDSTQLKIRPLRSYTLAKVILLVLSAVVLSGCLTTQPAKSSGEHASGYSYVPLDPVSVKLPADFYANCTNLTRSEMLLKVLPDNAVRVSVARLTGSGEVAYGPAAVASKGEAYRITLDYINADTKAFPMFIRKYVYRPIDVNTPTDESIIEVTVKTWFGQYTRKFKREYIPVGETPSGDYFESRIAYDVKLKIDPMIDPADKHFQRYSIPLYIGIGLRLIADVTVMENDVSVSGIGSIQTDSLRGTLTVQTLGVNGKAVAAALPIGSELNPTTVGNALVAIGSIKTLLYEEGVSISPRIVGMYLPMAGNNALVNAIISSLSEGADTLNWSPGNFDSKLIKK